MNIYILTVFFILMLILSYNFFDKELVHPAVIFSFMYTICIFSTIYNIEKWNVSISPKTMFLLMLGSLEFIGICFFVKRYFKKKHKTPAVVKYKKSSNTNSIMIALLVGYSIINIGLLIYFVYQIAGQFGEIHSFTEALSLFKTHTSYSNDASLPHFLSLMFKVMELSSYICIYLFFRNVIYFNSKNILFSILQNIYFLFVPLLYIIKELLSSSRITILQLLFASVVLGFLIWYQKNNWNRIVSLKFILSLGLVGAVGLCCFYFSASFIGRSNNKNMLDYITAYSGGSIECLNQYLQYPNPVDDSNIIGNETFYPLIRSLDKYGITNFNIENQQTAHLSFRYYKDTMIGNVYTAYRRWHHDFGILGVLILNGVMAFTISFLYYFFKYNGYKFYREYLLIVYSYIIYSVFLHPIDSYFYTTIFQVTFFTNLVLFFILFLLLTRVQIDIKQRRILYNDHIISIKNIKNYLRGE